MGVFQADWRGAEIGKQGWGPSGRREQQEQRQARPAQGDLPRVEHGWSAGAALGRAIEVKS